MLRMSGIAHFVYSTFHDIVHYEYEALSLGYSKQQLFCYFERTSVHAHAVELIVCYGVIIFQCPLGHSCLAVLSPLLLSAS